MHPVRLQHFSRLIRQPTKNPYPIASPSPFAQWGIDIAGRLPVGGLKFFNTATHDSTKWVEVKPPDEIKKAYVKRFPWKNIITQFGVPRAIVCDNGTQLVGNLIGKLCEDLNIQFFHSTSAYPQGDGQVKAAKERRDVARRRLVAYSRKWLWDTTEGFVLELWHINERYREVLQ